MKLQTKEYAPWIRYYLTKTQFNISIKVDRNVSVKSPKSERKRKSTYRQANGTTTETKYETGHDTRIMDNVWLIDTGYMRTTKDKLAYKHPAMFPEEMCQRHILTWSNENDIVFDPFIGSGTTAKMAKLNNRRYIGFELSKEYCEIANERICTMD